MFLGKFNSGWLFFSSPPQHCISFIQWFSMEKRFYGPLNGVVMMVVRLSSFKNLILRNLHAVQEWISNLYGISLIWLILIIFNLIRLIYLTSQRILIQLWVRQHKSLLKYHYYLPQNIIRVKSPWFQINIFKYDLTVLVKIKEMDIALYQ